MNAPDFCILIWYPATCMFCGCKPYWLSLLDVLGVRISGVGLKIARCGVQTFCSSGGSSESWVSYGLWVTTLWVEFSARLCLICSYLCWFGVFLDCPLRRSLSAIVLWFLSEEIFLYVAVHLVCLWEEVRSGSSYFTIFNQNFYCGVLMVVFCFSHSFHICYLKFILRKNSSPYMLVWGQWYLLFEYTPILLLFCCSNYSSAGISYTVVSCTLLTSSCF